MATEKSKERVKKAKPKKGGELHTEAPLSEKDEVKQAERNTQKQQNKGK